MKTEERATFILSQLNVGLRTEWSQIEGLEANLEKLLHEAKDRADAHLLPDRRDAWVAGWKLVERKLADLRGHATEARERFNAGGAADALEPWQHIDVHDREFDQMLETLRREGREAIPGIHLDPWYDSWKELWQQIEADLNTLRIHVVATRFQLEMRRDYGIEKADEVTREILEKLPADATLEDAERFAAEYRLAYYEVMEHREHPTWRDIFKGLLLFPEDRPEDRLPVKEPMDTR